MANAQILRNAIVEMQTALGATKTITGISQASAAVVTATHDYSVGDLIVFSGIVGMTQMNNKVIRVSAINTTVDFTCEGIDSTGFTAWASGGTSQKVDTTTAFDSITQFSLPDDPPQEIDVTTIHDDEIQIEFGMNAAAKGTLSIIADPLAATALEIVTARADNTRRAFKVTLVSGYIGIFNAFVAGGSGFDGGTGAAASGTISLTLRNPTQWFVS